jgi:hypothetical protein
MKLALYLPTFRNHVTVQELADLADPGHSAGTHRVAHHHRGGTRAAWPIMPKVEAA